MLQSQKPSKATFADRQTKPSFPKDEEEKDEKIPTFISANETLEFSEICSMSETILKATIAEKRDGEENGGDEVKMRPKELVSPTKIWRKRSFSGDSAGRIERRAKSLAMRSDPSPARSTPIHEMGWTNRSRTPTESTGFRKIRLRGGFGTLGYLWNWNGVLGDLWNWKWSISTNLMVDVNHIAKR
ncbi:hypothetical protein AAC387_Pa01g3378 [Persea americana]